MGLRKSTRGRPRAASCHICQRRSVTRAPQWAGSGTLPQPVVRTAPGARRERRCAFRLGLRAIEGARRDDPEPISWALAAVARELLTLATAYSVDGCVRADGRPGEQDEA